MEQIRSLLRGFGYAFHGIGYAIRTQRNLRIHLNAVALVALVGYLANLPGWKWAAAAICCGAVIALELVNTAIEVLCDRVTAQRDEAIAHAKDAAAGAVLVMAMAAVAVAAVVLFSGDSMQQLKATLQESPAAAVVLALAALASAAHVLVLSANGTGKETRK